jgi:5-(carboxyamino)imidazole ribonucleotide synthase
MVNLVGPEGGSGEYYLKGMEHVLSMEGVYIHLYGKQTSKPHRKLGHITTTAPDISTALEKAHTVRKMVSIQLC